MFQDNLSMNTENYNFGAKVANSMAALDNNRILKIKLVIKNPPFFVKFCSIFFVKLASLKSINYSDTHLKL